jgi:hypothetical protein
MDEDDEEEERDIMVDKVQALAVVQTKDSRAMSEFNDRMRAMSGMEDKSPYRKKSYNVTPDAFKQNKNVPDFVVNTT